MSDIYHLTYNFTQTVIPAVVDNLSGPLALQCDAPFGMQCPARQGADALGGDRGPMERMAKDPPAPERVNRGELGLVWFPKRGRPTSPQLPPVYMFSPEGHQAGCGAARTQCAARDAAPQRSTARHQVRKARCSSCLATRCDAGYNTRDGGSYTKEPYNMMVRHSAAWHVLPRRGVTRRDKPCRSVSGCAIEMSTSVAALRGARALRADPLPGDLGGRVICWLELYW